jgi:hypothetical protein
MRRLYNDNQRRASSAFFGEMSLRDFHSLSDSILATNFSAEVGGVTY